MPKRRFVFCLQTARAGAGIADDVLSCAVPLLRPDALPTAACGRSTDGPQRSAVQPQRRPLHRFAQHGQP